MWFHSIHIVNPPRMFKLLHDLLMPFTPQRLKVNIFIFSKIEIIKSLKENIFFHNSIKDLHAHIDPEILPEEYGGQLGPFDNSPCNEAIKRFDDYYAEVREFASKFNAPS